MQPLRLLSLLAILSACNTGTSKTGSTPASDALKQATAADWKGEIPCADCEGINYLLQLQPNDSFYERSVYLGKPGDAFVDKGTWQMGADSLVTLTNIAGETKYFAFKGDQLQMLDKEAKPITTALARKYNLERTTATPNAAGAQVLEGLDFAATGNEPFWSLEIGFGKTMHFKTPDGIDVTVPTGKGEKAMDAPVTRYHGDSAGTSLTVQIFRQACTNDMSGAVSGYTVKVDLKRKEDKEYKQFSGCGQFMGAYRINGLWQLEKIGSKAVEGTPTLELALNDEKVYGFGGCNRFGGSILPAGDHLTFGPLVSTEMACPDTPQETAYLKSLTDQTLSYQLDGEMLYIGEGDNKLTFRLAKTDPNAKGRK